MRRCLFCLLLLLVAPALAADAPRKPNIVLILADDLGYAELGCYGQEKIRTPHVDQMAKEGLRFTQFYAGNAVCATSRCVLLTGQHTGHCVVRTNREVKPEGQFPIPDETVTIAELLKAEGYATGATGKWGLGPPGSSGDPNKQGFDLFFGYNCQRIAHNHYPTHLWRNDKRVALEGNTAGITGKQHSHDLFEAEALAFIEKHRAEPFFLYVPFAIPHVALQVPEDSLAEYKDLWDDPPYEGKKGYLPHPRPRAAYAAMVTRMDRSVGRLLAKLKELKLDEHTLVLFTSDNGPTHGGVGGSDSEFFHSAGKLRGLKGSLYEGGIRVPLVARWPGRIEGGTKSDLPCAAYDLLPTFCELAGAVPPRDIDGLSLVPTLTGKVEQPRHDYLYWEFPSYGGQQALRAGDWKAVRQQLTKGRTAVELYNLATDPSESHNVAADHPDILARLTRLLATAHTPSPDFPLPSIDK